MSASGGGWRSLEVARESRNLTRKQKQMCALCAATCALPPWPAIGYYARRASSSSKEPSRILRTGAAIVPGNRMKFQRHVAHRTGQISYFYLPPVLPSFSPYLSFSLSQVSSPPPPPFVLFVPSGERRVTITIRLVWQTSVAS